MKKFYLLGIISLVLTGSCKRNNVNPGDVISNLFISNRTPNADGNTVISISATLNNQADADKNSVIFTATSGQFITANDTIITQKAIYQSGNLTATVRLKMPLTEGKIIIKAYPATASPYFTFLLKDSINTQKVTPDQLVLTPSALGIASNFMSEISLSGTLYNQKKSVSTGNKVIFEDYYSGGSPVGGRYRALRDTTDLTSTVSAGYSVGTLPVGTTFYIKCTWLDASGHKTSIKDSTLITVNK